MATFAVTYTYSDATSADRDELRPRHVEFLQAQYEAGRLVVSGPFGPEEDPGALLMVAGGSKDEVAALMDQDPFMVKGLIEERRIRQWNLFFGKDKLGL